MALSIVRVVELAGIYPSSFCSMILADFGAQVTRVVWDREYFPNFVNRGKKSLALNLRTPEGAAVLEQICLQSDVLIDPTPEGALGRGKILPEDMLQKNPRLIYVKVSAGVDLSSKNSQSKGHDINFLALSGVLSKFGRKDEIPQAPPNIQGSTIGGGVLGALGIVMALFERAQSGKGQTVNVNLIEGTAYASSVLWYLQNMDYYNKARGENLHDGGSPFYQTYQTSDGKFMAVGAYEPHIYEKFLKECWYVLDVYLL
uniref:Alpha-methylacyl-CoA racemase n=1 Tax=Rhinolophus ferrumequinum TaxID=59479 RepID=A0A671FR84_RHIFE